MPPICRRIVLKICISELEYRTHWKAYDEIAAMLTGLKRYLDPEGEKRSNRRRLPTGAATENCD